MNFLIPDDMPDKKLTDVTDNKVGKITDNEMIKALECLFGGGDSCTECAYHKRYRFGECRKQVAKDTLDLINCLQSQNKDLAEAIHNLTLEKDALFDKAEELKVEVERLESSNNEKFRQWDMLAEKTKQHYSDLYNEAKDILKAEAYKEFAEKLEEKIGDCHIVSDGEYCGFDCGDIHGCIDTLLKEMVGENDDR